MDGPTSKLAFEFPKGVVLVISLLPLTFATYVLLHDASNIAIKTSSTSYLSRFLQKIRGPFRDFLEWPDLAEYDPLRPVKIEATQWKRWTGVGCGVLASVVWSLEAMLRTVEEAPKPQRPFSLLTYHAWLMTVSWIYMTLRLAARPIHSAPIGNLLFFGTQIAYCLMNMTVSNHPLSSFLLLLLTGLSLYLLGTLPVSAHLPSNDVSPPKATPSSSVSSPEDSVSFWTWVTFSFPSLYYPVSSQRRLNAEDVWKLSPWFLHRNIFNKYLNVQSAYGRKGKEQSLIVFLLKANSKDIILDIVIELYKAIAGFIPPYALKQLLAVLSNLHSSKDNLSSKAHYWALVTLVAHLSFAQCDLAQGWCTRRCYERTRGVIFCALHWKALKRRVVGGATSESMESEGRRESQADQKEQEQSADLGKVVNLMQGDAYAVAQRFWELSPLFGAPVRIGVALWFLYELLGPSAFAGVGVILLNYLLNWPLIKWNLYITRNSWKARDKRMKGVNELFQGIRFLKMIGWESGWCKRVLEAREVELAWRVQENICNSILVFVWSWVPSATALASFIAYTLVAKQPLTVSVAFTALGVFSQLQSSMNALPGHIFALFHAYISMQRINGFLAEEEVPDWASSLKRASNEPQPGVVGNTAFQEKVGYESATLEWHSAEINKVSGGPSGDASTSPNHGSNVSRSSPSQEQLVLDEEVHPRLDEGQTMLGDAGDGIAEPVRIIQMETSREVALEEGRPDDRSNPVRSFRLEGITVLLPSGKLTLVTGNTGAGKTAFLLGLLGEMRLISGKIYLDKTNHRVAYCAQNPWLEHATIRDNIVYGSPSGFDEQRYDSIIRACALEKDLEILPAGDMTEIGEKGVSLSGGQRARVALARAMYSPAKTILLDDPLAAVDMHTARHIVKHCLGGRLMHNRTVILVTHHVRMCLELAECVVEIDGGKVVRSGRIADFDKDLKDILKVANDDTGESLVEGETAKPSARLENEVDTLIRVAGGTRTPSSSTEVDPSSGTDDTKGDGNPTPKWRLSTADEGKFIDEESRAEGRVSWKTYLTYIRAAGYWTWLLTLLLMILMRAINILDQFYLSKWGEAYNRQPTHQLLNLVLQPWTTVATSNATQSINYSSTNASNKIPVLDDLPPPYEDVKPWLFIYFLISIADAVTVLSFISLGFYASLIASRTLFSQMLLRLSHAPTRFFDVTPIGRILNRFVADIGSVDGAVNNSLRSALSGALSFVASFGVIVYVVPAFAPIALFIAWLYIRLAPPYVRTSRDLRRLESVALSPAFAGFDELLHGLVHVRAFGVEKRYQDRFYQRVDTFQAFDHSYWLVSFWLRWRYDCLGSVVVYLTTLFALMSSVSTGFAAVVILNAGVFAEASRQLVKVLAQVELDFNSIERIGEYLSVQQEAPLVIENSRPPAYWPSSTSGIIVEDLWIRYSSNSPDVLKGLSFKIEPGEKIGVVGRTGSGKTTLCAALLRMVECWRGRIIIDGIDISTIGLEDLRSRLTIVSQDVALFEGTIRSNLDPFDEYTDKECWDVLQRCHLAGVQSSEAVRKGQAVANKGNGGRKAREAVFSSLDAPISVGGGSLSAGQKQLVALARAMLRRAKVVLTDEATSAIDLELDDQVQQTIREELGDATVLTIAHRLRTVIEYDRILVLDHGRIAEYDTPVTLLRKQDGIFAQLCRGSADWEELRKLVRGL